jgi:hypothetical protein
MHSPVRKPLISALAVLIIAMLAIAIPGPATGYWGWCGLLLQEGLLMVMGIAALWGGYRVPGMGRWRKAGMLLAAVGLLFAGLLLSIDTLRDIPHLRHPESILLRVEQLNTEHHRRGPDEQVLLATGIANDRPYQFTVGRFIFIDDELAQLQPGQAIRIHYLPYSRVVMSYQIPDYSVSDLSP